MFLSRYNLKHINSAIAIPDESIFALPEKVVQFGTGVLLRGLPDYFIDKANKKGIFNGRVVIVKSTSKGDSSSFEKQDGLYTVCVRGVNDGIKQEEDIINASISRVLSAADDWEKILETAADPNIQVIISNTTEVGIQLVHDDIKKHPPDSFPGKLLAYLYHRFQAFQGSSNSGLIIIPTELVTNNGKLLESIVLELAHLNSLEESFIEWLENSNRFCNSLVDRIVPGKPERQVQNAITSNLGYNDDLLIMTETYKLWAIEGDNKIKEQLAFAQADDGLVITSDIDLYRELKLRILNGSHTLSCGMAFLSGCITVKDAMDNHLMARYISELIYDEIIPGIPYKIDNDVSSDFAKKVLDRFRNPYLKHNWINITVQYSSKLKLRCVPVLQELFKNDLIFPKNIALGFAAYILFMKSVRKNGNEYFGEANGELYPIIDDQAQKLYNIWLNQPSIKNVVHEVLSDIDYWGCDLTSFTGFEKDVINNVELLQKEGAVNVLKYSSSKTHQL